ncbi:MAG: sugar phosphate isomerase/epimerase family protein [Deltaproteobacteria bacterium]
MSLSISTAWNAFRSSDAERMIYELRDLGFEEVELSFNLTSGMVDAVEGLVSRGKIKVTSVHNFCPIPEGLKREQALPDFFSMSSMDSEQRALAVEYGRRSIDTAARLNARAVVLHCGRVEMEDMFRDLVNLYHREGTQSPFFQQARSALVRTREEKAQVYLDNTLRSLGELNRHAEKRGIYLGVETRYYYSEIPSCQEVRRILDAFKGGRIRYWHDVGHAQVAENLGLARQEDFLAAYRDEMVGMHLHDVVGSSDHKTPSTGDLDFSRLNPYITKETIKVLEIHHPAPPQDLVCGRDFLKTVFDGKA